MRRRTASNRRLLVRRLSGHMLRVICVVLLAGTVVLMSGPRRAPAAEAQWIWSPAHAKDAVPAGSVYFRKEFTVRAPAEAQILITADDAYELYVNGRRIGGAETAAKELDSYNITRLLDRGRNLIAVKVTNLQGSSAALAARVMVKDGGEQWTTYSTDASWKTSLGALPLWHMSLYNDARWDGAREFGALGETVPWDRQESVAVEERHRGARFRISEEFEVQRVMPADKTGSLIAMTFNEFGHVLASQGGGPLMLIYDAERPENAEKLVNIRVYCDKVTNCQGILSLNGDVFVTGEGPDGSGLYRLSDSDRDGTAETVKTLIRFKGQHGEHGPHGLTLGPDGLIYVVVGNHTSPEQPMDPGSPLGDVYEGDLVQPRYEDPGGHAAGRKAPGGMVLRTDIEGSAVQLVAGGLRNAYDLTFNREGELFVHDSDMESDLGTNWYRPTSLYHVVPGGEFGWRSGWAKWPAYFPDRLPTLLETGRGSPTGAAVYDHHMFPVRYHGALFLADWSEGRILTVRTKRDGAGYTADSEVFLEGQPLNVTDLEVGPDGWLYFVTGGRDTSGGLYRVTWRGTVPAEVTKRGTGISAVIRQPQLHSAWSRQQIAQVQRELGDDWQRLLKGVVRSSANPAEYRIRALDVMQLFGPAPDLELLTELSKSDSAEVRAKVAAVLAAHRDEPARQTLVAMLDDEDGFVRRKACESLLQCGGDVPIEALTPLLVSEDRYEAWAARLVLQRQPVDAWREAVLSSDDHRLFIQGSIALLTAEGDKQAAMDVLQRAAAIMNGFVSDKNFIDMLRVMQVALMQGEVAPSEVDELRNALADEFPASNAIMNRELIRLLAYLQVDSIMHRYFAQLQTDVQDVEKLHLALHMRFLKDGWTSGQKLKLLEFYENAIQRDGGDSYPYYVVNVTRDFAKTLSSDEVQQVLARGAEWPNAALGAIAMLPKELDAESLSTIQQLDQQLQSAEGEAVERLKVGVVAVLGRSGDEASMAYLRQIWDRDPERRQAAAVGLAQAPAGDNWDYLVRTLPALSGGAGREVMSKLATVDRRPDAEDAETFRQVILLGLNLEDIGAPAAVGLLEQWTGEQLASLENEDAPAWQNMLAPWQQWFAKTYPDHAEATLPVSDSESKWNMPELLAYLTGDEVEGSAKRGAEVFAKAKCAKCHRFGPLGESMGPDLSSISKRFTKKEILESILFPSHVVSDQYASKTVVTTQGRSYVGIVAPGANGELTILQANGEKLVVRGNEIEQVLPSKVSAMPSGLLDTLTLEEVADLFALLDANPQPRVTRRKLSDGNKPATK